MTWACAYVYVILRVRIYADTHPQQPVFAENHDPPSSTATPSEEHHQARTEVLKWQPLCIFYEVCLLHVCTSAKPSHRCFKAHLVSIRRLGSFILACHLTTLPVPVPLASACPDSGVSIAISCNTVFPKHLYHHSLPCAVTHPQLLLLLHHPLQADRKVNFYSPPSPRGRSTHQVQGTFHDPKSMFVP